MAVRASIRLNHRGCVTQRLVDGKAMVQVSGERGWDLYVVHGPDARALDDALDIVCWDPMQPPDVLARSETSAIFRGRNPPGGVVETIRAAGCVVLWPAVYRDGLEFLTVLAPGRSDLGQLTAALAAQAEVEVERVEPVRGDEAELPLPVGSALARLTPRQLEVLRLAVREGFYESPRGATPDSIGTMMGLSPSTVKEHLVKAERVVLGQFVRVLDDAEALGGRPQGGRGRPVRQRSTT